MPAQTKTLVARGRGKAVLVLVMVPLVMEVVAIMLRGMQEMGGGGVGIEGVGWGGSGDGCYWRGTMRHRRHRVLLLAATVALTGSKRKHLYGPERGGGRV